MKPTTRAVIGDHRPPVTNCRDRAEHAARLLGAATGLTVQPARTPIAHRHADGVTHADACPATDHGPCLDGILGGRGW
jgi:hypothetical protein